MRLVRFPVNTLQTIAVSLCFPFLFIGCKENTTLTDDSYANAIRHWQEQRVRDLQADDGWLNLAGLFALQEGENTFGADDSNDIVFPQGKAPDKIGSFSLTKGAIAVSIDPGIQVMADNYAVHKLRLLTDKDDKPTILEHGTLRWYIIQRGDKFFVRLRDLESPALKGFTGIESYPIDKAWRIPAVLDKHAEPKIVPVPNILGQTIDWESPGTLKFEIDGKTYRLEALGQLNDPQLFVIFADETNRDETYPAGRFLYVDTPGKDGKTFIDFNRAYNPPCAFTAYATCPLPPEQNHLPVRITAGEKNYESSGH